MSDMEKVTELEIIETSSVKVEKPVVIVGLPGVGLVGVIASTLLAGSQEMKNIGYIKSDLLPPMIILHKGRIFDPVRIYSKDKLLLITSEMPLPTEIVRPLARSIVKWAKEKDPLIILMLGGINVPNRTDIEKPECYSVETNEQARRILEKAKIENLSEGIMVGPYPMILRGALKEKLPAAAILAQAYGRYPDPGAAASVLETLSKLLDIKVNVNELLEKAEEIRVKMRDLMRRTDQTMRKMGKEQELELPAMYA